MAALTSCENNVILLYSTGCLKVLSDFFFALFSLIIKIDLVKVSMQFLIHLKFNNWNITNQNVLLYVSWHFLSGEVRNIRASKVSYFTFLFSRRSVGSCLSSSSIVVFVFWGMGGWIFVCCLVNDTPDGPYGTHITLVYRPVDLCWYKVCKVFWHHVRSVRRFFLFTAFRLLLQIVGHNSPYRRSRNFDIVKLKNVVRFFFVAFR